MEYTLFHIISKYILTWPNTKFYANDLLLMADFFYSRIPLENVKTILRIALEYSGTSLRPRAGKSSRKYIKLVTTVKVSPSFASIREITSARCCWSLFLSYAGILFTWVTGTHHFQYLIKIELQTTIIFKKLVPNSRSGPVFILTCRKVFES